MGKHQGEYNRAVVRLTTLFLIFCLLAWAPLPFFGDFDGVIDHRHNLVVPAAARHALLEHGELPWWNPWARGGFSGIGAMEDATFFPTFPLTLAFDVFVATLLEYLLFSALGALGIFVLARHFGTSRESSLVASLAVLGANTLPIYLLGGWGMHFTMALIPWGLWLWLQHGRRYTLALAVLLCLFFLRGGQYPLAYLIIMLGFMALSEAIRERSPSPLLRLAGAGALALSLAAIKLIPALTSNDLGEARGTEGYCFNLHGMAVALSTWTLTDSQFEGCGAIGPVALVLALFGIRKVRALWLPTAFLALYALGSNLTPDRWFSGPSQHHICGEGFSIHDLIESLPFLDGLWNPSRALVPVGMVLAVAAGLGLDRLLSALAERYRGIIATAVGLAVLVPAFYEARTYLYRHMKPLSTPAAVEGTFRQADICGKNDAFCPRLRRGSARSATFAFHGTSTELRTTADTTYLGEEYWLGDGKVALQSWAPSTMTYRLDGSGEGWLVINQNFKPGWTVAGDVRGEARSYQGLLAVRAVAPGDVSFTYRPIGFWPGAAASLLGFAVLVFLWRRED